MRVNRLLSMLLIISKEGLVTAKELSEHFEVAIRTIYHDIEKISEAGIPIASTSGKGGGYYIMENYNIDNFFLSKNEALKFISVMGNLKFLFGRNRMFNDIILKFEKTFEKEAGRTDTLSINMSHFTMESELKDYLYLMDKSIEQHKLLIFDYINRNMEYSERVVEPIQIAFSGGQWYLVAFCRTRNDYRRFKLVRIRNVRLGITFDKKAMSQADIDKIYQNNYQKQSIKVTLKFSNSIGEQLTEHFYKENIEKIEDGQFIVVDDFPYEDGLIKFILSFGKECEVIEPLYLREETKKYVKKILLQYND